MRHGPNSSNARLKFQVYLISCQGNGARKIEHDERKKMLFEFLKLAKRFRFYACF